MAQFTDEWNTQQINKILGSEYPKEKEKLIKNFYGYLKKVNFTLESQKTKLKHVKEFFEKLGSKKVSTLTEKEIDLLIDGSRFREMKISLNYFFNWYKNNLSTKTYNEVQKENRIKRIKAILNFKGFNTKQKNTIKRYHSALKEWGVSLESERGYLQQAKTLVLEINKDIDKLTKKDIGEYLTYLGKKYKKKTIFEKRMFLCNFLSWYLKVDKDKLDLVKDITLKKPRGTKLPEEILSPDDIKKIIQVADNFRDKCLVVLLYETGARKGEFLQLRIKDLDITNKEYGMVNVPQGKTNARKVPVIYSVPYINDLLNSHPNRDDLNSSLFITQGAWLGRALGEDGLKRVLKILGKRAGIKKNIYPHLFRHSRLTELAKELTEHELKKFAGWTPNSNMASVYVHLSGSDVSNKILANAGLIEHSNGVQENKEKLRSKKCPRCEKINPATNKYCLCGCILDLKQANIMLQDKELGEKKVSHFLGNKPVEDLFKMMEMLQKQINEIKK